MIGELHVQLIVVIQLECTPDVCYSATVEPCTLACQGSQHRSHIQVLLDGEVVFRRCRFIVFIFIVEARQRSAEIQSRIVCLEQHHRLHLLAHVQRIHIRVQQQVI